MKHLFLCTQPRTGSSLLLHLLQFGDPDQQYASLSETLFNARAYQRPESALIRNIIGPELGRFCLAEELQSKHPFDPGFFKQTLQQFYARYSHGNAVTIKWFPFGFNLFLDQMAKHSLTVNKALFESVFGSIDIVYLYRQNVVQQAISRYIAGQTNAWRAYNTSNIVKELPYNYEAIRSHFDHYADGHQYWTTRFQQFHLQPALTVSYEALAENYEAILLHLSQALNIPVHIPAPEEVVFQKQANELNAAMEAQFRADMLARGDNPNPLILPDGTSKTH